MGRGRKGTVREGTVVEGGGRECGHGGRGAWREEGRGLREGAGREGTGRDKRDCVGG